MAYDDFTVDWDKLSEDPHTYERMVAVLLSNLHPTARRTDGAGGDGGKDVWFPTPTGPEVFELKSFSRRMTPARWAQVERSLARAATLKTSAWHLVLPIDFTPAEEAKFAEVTAAYDFPCDYFGLTWLDARMADQPQVPRHYLQGGAAKVTELLTQLHQEQANLTGGAPDLLARLQRLFQLADEVDPHYRLGFGVSPTGEVGISLSPRYVGAEDDRPVTITTSFTFPDSPEGLAARDALADALRFGAAAVIPSEFVSGILVDAPAGFGGEHPTGEIQIAGIPLADREFAFNFVILNPDGKRLASLPLVLGPRTLGAAGFEAMATDPTGAIRCRVRTDLEALRMNLRYEMNLPVTCLPALALPTVRFLSQFGAPNQLQLEMQDGTPINPPMPLERKPPVQQRYVDLVAAFERVQAYSQVYFNLPTSVDEHDYRALMEADVLVRGETLRVKWTAYTMHELDGGPLIEQAKAGGVDLLGGDGFSLLTVADYSAEICGHKVPLGPCTHHLITAVIENIDDVRKAVEEEPTNAIDVRLRPGANDDATFQLGAPSDPVSFSIDCVGNHEM
jgi:hypothetical protein